MDNNSDTLKGSPSKRIKVELPENVTTESKNVSSRFLGLTCKQCGTIFTRKWLLDRHKASVHGEKKKIKCDLCDQTFTRNDKMRRHISAVHEEKQFECHECEFSHQGKIISTDTNWENMVWKQRKENKNPKIRK